MKPRSIRFRLTAWYSTILAVTFCAVGAGTYLAMRESIHDTVDADLRTRLKSMREYLQRELPAGPPGSVAEEFEERAGLGPGGDLFQIVEASGKPFYRSAGMSGWRLTVPEPAQLPSRGKAKTFTVNGKPMRVLAGPLLAAGRAYTVQIAAPIDEFYELLDDFRLTLLWASPLVLLLASAGGYWMSRRALEPVDAISRAAQAIGAQNLSRRLPVRATGDELERLSTTLNGMFARLQAAFERVTRFTADASHELRAPVTVIRTTAELARQQPRTVAEYCRALDQIQAESERTSRLIENLLLLARADAGAGGLNFETVDLVECVRDACAEGRILAEAGQLCFDADLPSDGCAISGDFQALRRLFLSLLDNAVKYTAPHGSVHVSMRVENAAATVEVRDTGIGIDAGDLPHIFERFYRADRSRSRESGGAGLGLSIAQWVAEHHHGEILVESAPGSGSIFRVRLPLIA